jgi:hypothetical protein
MLVIGAVKYHTYHTYKGANVNRNENSLAGLNILAVRVSSSKNSARMLIHALDSSLATVGDSENGDRNGDPLSPCRSFTVLSLLSLSSLNGH